DFVLHAPAETADKCAGYPKLGARAKQISSQLKRGPVMADIRIEGTCESAFARVRQAFADNLEKRGEYGAAVAVTVDGRPVVDLWGGYADKARTRPWTHDTLANVFSTTKGLTAICAHRLAAEGRLELDTPVARYWPEFAQKGKSAISVRQLLNHRA